MAGHTTKYTPAAIRDHKLIEELRSFNHGKYYDAVMKNGQRYIQPFFEDIPSEFNLRKFPVKSMRSYSKIPEYYTIPMGKPYIDQHPVEPYGVPAVQPVLPNANTTPELLIEPYMDELVLSYHTISEMLDMFSKKILFEIVEDRDVVTIYFKIEEYFRQMSDMNLTGQHETVKMLNSLKQFQVGLETCFKQVCNKHKWEFNRNTLTRLFNRTAR